jgi:hypothetical protein
MKPNVGPTERTLRLGAGTAALLVLPFVRSRWASALLGALATSGITTGLSRYCPLNDALGIDNAPGLGRSPLQGIRSGAA